VAERKNVESTTLSPRTYWVLATGLVLSFALGACQKEPPINAVLVEDLASIDTTLRTEQSGAIDQPTAPRIERRPDGPVLVLPEKMERAVRAAVPGFAHRLFSEYAAEIQEARPPTETSALFAVIGDFNGDKRADVVVEGVDATRSFILVLFTENDSVRVFTVDERPLAAAGPTPRHEFLALVPRGIVHADTVDDGEYEKVPVRLAHDGFNLVYWEKAAEFYYWRGGRFMLWITSD
jgi:hypothetical protein